MKEQKSIFLKVDDVEPVYYADNFTLKASALKGVKVWIKGDGHFFECDKLTVCDPVKAVEEGRSQVVALAKKLGEMKFVDKKELFDDYTTPDILIHFSYDEIVEKLDTWKKEKETIRVRDEVYNKALDVRFVVTKIFTPCDGDVIVNGLKKDGTAIKGLLRCNVEKTGVHVDDLDAYLEV